jgi:hypothetical protein
MQVELFSSTAQFEIVWEFAAAVISEQVERQANNQSL